MSEMMSLRWWKDTRSSRVSALTMRKLPSFRPTARALPSGEKQQQRPPAEDNVFAAVGTFHFLSGDGPCASGRRLTFSEFAHGQHAVAGRQVPYAQGFVIADGGAEREVGVAGKAPHFSLHVTLERHTRHGSNDSF